METRAKTAKNLFRSVTDWRLRREEAGNWWVEKGAEIATGLFFYEKALLDCVTGQWERCWAV